jgi:hypothetical protein
MNFIRKFFGLDKKQIDKSASAQAKFLDSKENNVSHTMPISKKAPQQHYIIKHNGEYMIFDSKDEMPDELKEHISEIEKMDRMSSVYNVIVDGKRKQYKNYNEIPEEIRQIIDKK